MKVHCIVKTQIPFFKYYMLKLNGVYTYAVCTQMLKARMANQFNTSHSINTRMRDLMQPVYDVYPRLTMSQRAISFAGLN